MHLFFFKSSNPFYSPHAANTVAQRFIRTRISKMHCQVVNA